MAITCIGDIVSYRDKTSRERLIGKVTGVAKVGPDRFWLIDTDGEQHAAHPSDTNAIGKPLIKLLAVPF